MKRTKRVTPEFVPTTGSFGFAFEGVMEPGLTESDRDRLVGARMALMGIVRAAFFAKTGRMEAMAAGHLPLGWVEYFDPENKLGETGADEVADAVQNALQLHNSHWDHLEGVELPAYVRTHAEVVLNTASPK